MNFSWDREQLELREAVIGFARKHLNVPPGDESADRGFRRDLWQECADFGILGLPVPREFGGSDLGIMTTTAAMEALGYACHDHGLLFALHAHMWAVLTPLLAFGTEEQKHRWIP